MEKTVTCNYWKKNVCKFMNNSEKCRFSHGPDDFKDITIDCKYGTLCNNSICKFYHGNISTIKNVVYEIPIINKKLLKKNKKLRKIENIKSNNFEKVKVEFLEKEDKCMEKYIVNESNNNNYYNNIINKLKLENDLLKLENKKLLKNQEIKNNYSISGMVYSKDNNIKKGVPNKDKLLILYNKYVNIYNIFKDKQNNYKNIDMNEIKKYTKDNNIYKIKQRSTKIYNFYNKIINGTVKEYLPISKIIKIKF